MAGFPFGDLHSYKDFVGFVRMCAPDNFPVREGLPPDDQWSLALAFRGLREGLALAILEKGERSEFSACSKLIDDAFEHYQAGRKRDGFFALDEAQRVLRRIRTQ